MVIVLLTFIRILLRKVNKGEDIKVTRFGKGTWELPVKLAKIFRKFEPWELCV
jgi:hypothetical protein